MIELYINGQSVDCQDKIDYTLNKCYENATDPTTYKNDFSKTIKIPITAKNVAIFGAWQRVDRVTVGNGTTGYNYDSNAKIPFVLYNNGTSVYDGYVKFSKCTYTLADSAFEVTLNSNVSDWYTKLKELDASDIDDELGFTATIDRQLVFDCWQHTHNYNAFDCLADYIGFSMCNNGTYPEFKSDKILERTTDTEAKDVPYGEMYEGWNGEYRSYYQRPYVRVDGLFDYVRRISEKNGFDVYFDRFFFNKNNPYYSQAVLLCDMLGVKSENSLVGSYTISTGITTYQPNTKYLLTPTAVSVPSEVTSGVSGGSVNYVSAYVQNVKITNLNFQPNVTNVFGVTLQLLQGNTVVASKHIKWNNKQIVDDDGNALGTVELSFNNTSSGQLYLRIVMSGSGYTFTNSGAVAMSIEYSEKRRSGSAITFERILGSDFKVADFVCAYCKLFNIHVLSEGATIKFVSRDTLFRYGASRELKIDRSTFEITPYRFDSGYVLFDYKESDVTANKQYRTNKDYSIGAKKLTTSYKFNSETKTLFDTFQNIVSENAYNVFDLSFGTTQYKTDRFPLALPSFQNKENDTWETVEKCYALGFEVTEKFGNFVERLGLPLNRVFVSDDSDLEYTNQEFYWHDRMYLDRMLQLDDGDGVVANSDSVKYVSAFLTYNNVNYAYLWVQPDVSYLSNNDTIKETVSGQINCKYIYKTFWQNYIENDRYSTDAKQVSTYALLSANDYQSLSFGDLVDIDGVHFHVNKITDYNPNELQPTKVELVKVDDKTNYYYNYNYLATTISTDYLEFEKFFYNYGSSEQEITLKLWSNLSLTQSSFSLPSWCEFVSLTNNNDEWYLTLRLLTAYGTPNDGYIKGTATGFAYNLCHINQRAISTKITVSPTTLSIASLGFNSVRVTCYDFDKLDLVVPSGLSATWGRKSGNTRVLSIKSMKNENTTTSYTIQFKFVVSGTTKSTNKLNVTVRKGKSKIIR